ncbi:GtrA family protein [Homoserinibacter sp. GY 40078]|uniref:GtrA family protein n=1 Tax=Homoserinibacter sp. GY 40078 TaxID=2603275 RepID=UPI0011C85FD0|nr:GtrA family protein [Homoserinibacter sp. GY 40078]TXK16240.1 GtrA family protein [Homoserinibacter sp. GY 40078]
MRKLITQFTRFGVVGLVGLVIDFGVFNLLRLTVLSPEQLHEGPVIAKAISTALAIIANWIGNRYWTFREHRGRQLWREFAEFLVVSLGGMAIGLASLWVSHYLLGFTSILADNIATNVVGLALGTLFRFSFYRLWVFAPHRGDTSPPMFPADGTASESARAGEPGSDTGAIRVSAGSR